MPTFGTSKTVIVNYGLIIYSQQVLQSILNYIVREKLYKLGAKINLVPVDGHQ